MSSRKNLVISILFWIIMWEVITFMLGDRTTYPSLINIIANTFKVLRDPKFILVDVAQSFKRLGISLLVAMPVSYVLALLAIRYKLFESIMQTFVSATFPLPKIALLPLFLLIFGIGDLTKIVLITFSIFFLIFINTFEGARRLTTSELNDVMKIYKTTSFNYWYEFLAKGCYPYFLIGLKSGLGYGMTMVVVSEYSLSNNGLGYFIWSSWDQFRILDMYSGIFILALIGYFLNQFCNFLIVRSKV